MPFSFLKENTVFLIATAILKNFFLHLLDVIGGRVKGLDRTARLKRFLRMFVIVPAKWIKSGRRNALNLYTNGEYISNLSAEAPEDDVNPDNSPPRQLWAAPTRGTHLKKSSLGVS